ncbi:MAG TPA: ribonuclease HII [Thermomicrobiales bacterium]|nr:ribonuclease HII [Thermomicrobiales bacterium]
MPNLVWERNAWRAGKLVVAGVDEVGRGAWAGPLVAAAVALPAEPTARARLTRTLNRAGALVRDSKQLSADQRRRVVDVIEQVGVPFAIAEIPVDVIDRIGVGRANKRGLRDAAAAIRPAADHVLVDAFEIPDLLCSCDAIVRGDCVSLSIALASIVAKTHRDRIMIELGEQWPEYGFALHKGYGTVLHQRALAAHGPTRHHRASFAPVRRLLTDVVAD